jgi:hypothetical protein
MYKYSRNLTSCTHHIINIHIYLYYMHIKNHPTHPENIELKGTSYERPEKPIEDR